MHVCEVGGLPKVKGLLGEDLSLPARGGSVGGRKEGMDVRFSGLSGLERCQEAGNGWVEVSAIKHGTHTCTCTSAPTKGHALAQLPLHCKTPHHPLPRAVSVLVLTQPKVNVVLGPQVFSNGVACD